jgi:phosphatidylinositol alpha 1,6-mannosyltransferase
MERYLERHGMRRWVHLAGRCDRETIHQIHAASDVYLAPATLESFGIAALEARCAGVPVVAMRVGGVGEFVRHGREGLLVGSDAEMAQATADLLTAPERLQAMREHNRRTEPVTTWGRVLELTEAAYHRAGVPSVIDLRRPTVRVPSGPASVRRFVRP